MNQFCLILVINLAIGADMIVTIFAFDMIFEVVVVEEGTIASTADKRSTESGHFDLQTLFLAFMLSLLK